jgi:hypothetical protein
MAKAVNLRQRAPGDVEEAPILPRPFPRATLSDVEGNTVPGPSQLIGERSLLAVRESLGSLGALDCESLCMLPSLERAMDGHQSAQSPPVAPSTQPFARSAYPSYALTPLQPLCIYASMRLACAPARLAFASPTHLASCNAC